MRRLICALKRSIGVNKDTESGIDSVKTLLNRPLDVDREIISPIGLAKMLKR